MQASPPRPTRRLPRRALLSLTVPIALSGCFITAPEGQPSLTECEAQRVGALADCVCDRLTSDLVCPEGVMPDADPPDADPPDADLSDADTPDADTPDADTPDADLSDIYVIDADVRDAGDIAPLDMSPPSCGAVELPAGCGCDVFTGEIICEGAQAFTCASWTLVYALNAPSDPLSCLDGATRVRFDVAQGLWVGVTRCPSGLERLYLSDNGSDYLPAGDQSGYGQDHCELIQPGFSPLTSDDDITSGGCADCSTTMPITLSGPVFERGRYGERFVRAEASDGTLAARLFCGSPACP